MRRLLLLAALVFVGSCGDSLLAPVTTLDGSWTGTQGGYSMSLGLAQTDSTITGNVTLGGVAGIATGTVTGTFIAPNVTLTFTLDGFDDQVKYTGTLSTENAKIFGKLNGSGFVNQELDVRKK